MAKYPREELSYKKLYKKINIDRNIEIEWPEKQDIIQKVTVDETQSVYVDNYKYTLDENDEEFCKTSGIDSDEFADIFQILDCNFIEEIYRKIDGIKIQKPGNICDICGKNKKTDDRMIICQGCLISVHENCYGVVEETGERWLCRRCIFHYEDAKCKFCNSSDGMLKKTVTNEWCHVVCAQIIPGLSFSNMNIKDPVEIVEIQPFEGICQVCNENGICLVKCSFDECDTYYHSRCCAERLYCDIGNTIGYCKIHDPIHNRKKITSKRKLLKSSELYPEIDNTIVLRHKNKFSTPKDSKYMRIIRKEPVIIKKGLEKYENNSILKNISDYWKNKRKEMGYYFDDAFMFPNYFMGMNLR